MRPRRRTPAVLPAILLAAAAAACGGAGETPGEPELQVTEAWARAAAVAPDAPSNGAVYFTAANHGGQADRLVAARYAGADRTMIHETFVDERGVAGMRHLDAVEVPAGAEVRFEPGGRHLMLMGLAASLAPGDTIEVTLEFERSGELRVRVPVRPL
ncbi:MAG: copper chaperone PCu(A)C [Gemmatimonadota bacterium]|nr:copper chaperone PCu(A)C [Gemmatimonadota bacterium]